MPPSESESVVPVPAPEPVPDVAPVQVESAPSSATETPMQALEEVPAPVAVESTPEPVSSPEPTVSSAAPAPAPAPAQSAPPLTSPASPHFGRYSPQEAHTLAVAAKRSRMERILNRIMVAVGKRGSIANDDVQKLTHVSDRTASKYLGILTTRGLLKRIGLPNHARYKQPE